MFRREETGFIPYAIALGALFLALGFGAWFPDFDAVKSPLQWFGILRHRSILTHGFLIPLLILGIVIRQAYHKPNLNLRFAAVGFFIAIATHLCFDLFPYRWSGFACIHIPLIGSTSALFSQIWLFTSAVLCFWFVFRLLRNIGELMAVAGAVVVCYSYGAYNEPRLLFYTPLALLPALFIGFVLPRARKVIDLTDTPGMI